MVSKRFQANLVLDAVSFSVLEGSITGLIGPNGSGKTTLFEALAGQMPVDAGEVLFRGKPVSPADRKTVLFYLPDGIKPWAQQPAGWLLQMFEGIYAAGAREVDSLVDALQLGGLLKQRAGTLSKGQLKRLLLALGLLTPHPLLLLDEPFDGLDFRQTRDVITLLKSLPSKGRTLLLSIHQLSDAARICDRLVLLNEGRVAGEGTLEELNGQAGLSCASLEEVFLALT